MSPVCRGRLIEWISPTEMGFNDHKFIKNGMTFADVNQSNYIGNCWYVAALASLTLKPDRLTWAIQLYTNNFSKEKYTFKFYHMGKWVEYVVDGLLPRVRSDFINATSNESVLNSCIFRRNFDKLIKISKPANNHTRPPNSAVYRKLF